MPLSVEYTARRTSASEEGEEGNGETVEPYRCSCPIRGLL